MFSERGISMTAKGYLQQIYHFKNRINRLMARREEIRAEMYSVKSPAGVMSPDRVQSSITGDKLERLIARVDELERDIVAEIESLEKSRRRISEQIEAVPNETYRTLLHERYELCWKWEKIAVDLNVSIRHVYRLHGEALQAFEKIIRH